MKGSGGITLIELVIVISIITILFTLATIEFGGFQRKYDIESEIKNLYSDLMGARMKAMNENRDYVVKFVSPYQYVVEFDKDKDGAVDTTVPKYSKDGLKFPLKWSLGGIDIDHLTFDNRGLVNVNGNVRVDKENSSEYDCLVISNTRIKMGKWDVQNGTCNPK